MCQRTTQDKTKISMLLWKYAYYETNTSRLIRSKDPKYDLTQHCSWYCPVVLVFTCGTEFIAPNSSGKILLEMSSRSLDGPRNWHSTHANFIIPNTSDTLSLPLSKMADVFELPKSKMAVIITKSQDNDKAKNKAVTALRPRYVTTSAAAQQHFLWHNNNSLQVE